METKKVNKISTSILVVVCLVVILVIGISINRLATAESDLTPPVIDQPFIEEDEDAIKITQTMSAFAGDQKVDIPWMSISPSQIAFQLCLDTPFPSDWGPKNLTLQIGGKVYTDFSTLYDENPKAPDAPPYQCTLNKIPLFGDEPISEFTLTIEQISDSIPEQPDCDAAQEKLDQAGYAIKFTCDHQEFFFGYEVVEKPAEMSDLEAQQIVDDSFHHVIRGPWVFEIKP